MLYNGGAVGEGGRGGGKIKRFTREDFSTVAIELQEPKKRGGKETATLDNERKNHIYHFKLDIKKTK